MRKVLMAVMVLVMVMGMSLPAMAIECSDMDDCNIKLMQLENQLIQMNFELGTYKAREAVEANQAKIAELTAAKETTEAEEAPAE
jgi:hypothetical protein